MKMFVCTTCAPSSLEFLRKAQAAFPEVSVTGVECMSGCTRAQTVAFRATGKVAYLFGEVTEADFHELETFCNLYSTSSDGSFEDARALGKLRHKAIARVPA